MPPTPATRSVSHWLLAFLLLLITPFALAAPTTPTESFIDNGDGTVTHSITGLTWMRCAMGMEWKDGTCNGTASAYTGDEATKLTANFAGKSDWRLPSIAELNTIVERENFQPAINGTIFPNMPLNWAFWSGSPPVGNSEALWFVNFEYGHAYVYYWSLDFAVRLVRGGQSFDPLAMYTPSTDFFDNGDGTVTHLKTGLMWKRCAEGQTWSGAVCAGNAAYYDGHTALGLTSNSAGHNDWRIPTENELLTIVEYRASRPAINATIFSNTPEMYFWSGSPFANYSYIAWVVDFYDGSTNHNAIDERYTDRYNLPVRLVRAGQFFGTWGFQAKTGVAANTSIDSNVLKVYGNGGAIRIQGGQYAINGGAYTSDPGTVKANDSVSVRVTSAATPKTRTFATLTIGAVSGVFGVTTIDTPNCTLSASPVVIAAGASATLTANCNPAATSYVWTASGFGSDASSGTVSPAKPTLYSVAGVNAIGTGTPASAAVYVCNTVPSENYPGLTFLGTALADAVSNTIGADSIEGAAGVDTVIYQCNRSSFTITKTASGWKVSSAAEGIDTLTNVELIQFNDETLALDLSGNAGKVYRLYQAAFNRKPDIDGLRYWIGEMDWGQRTWGIDLLDVARHFIASDEFRRLYGANPTNAEFLTRLYNNVLHRPPDQDGYIWWLNQLDSGKNRSKVLADFSESPENQANVLNAITNGINPLN